jgi:hypothetical protein
MQCKPNVKALSCGPKVFAQGKIDAEEQQHKKVLGSADGWHKLKHDLQTV